MTRRDAARAARRAVAIRVEIARVATRDRDARGGDDARRRDEGRAIMMLQRPPNRDRTREFAAVADRVRKTMGASASANDRASTAGAVEANAATGGGHASDFAKVRSIVYSSARAQTRDDARRRARTRDSRTRD